METFTVPKDLMENPDYQEQRRKTLAVLSDDMIDAPIIGLVTAFNTLPHCFTLQSCYGHFLCSGRSEPRTLEPMPVSDTIEKVTYRIAYIALCVENSIPGKALLRALRGLTAIDPENIQFCCAEWFWERQVNSYALQVLPDRFKHQDTAILDYREAVRIEQVRDRFFARLGKIPQERR